MKRKDFLKLGLLTGTGILFHPFIDFASPFLPDSISQNVTFYSAKDADYNSLRNGFNSRISKHPSVIAVCKNSKGVQEAVQYAIKFNLPITIKSGGHCMEGLSCGEGSMQINLSLLNKIEWINNYQIKVGPGCLLHEIYETLLPKKRILPGGSCATVGIGGLTLGGGYGLMSRLFGLTCDSLEEVTMIDGNGKLISSKTDPDLLWACKGGANGNFGIITEMKFKVHNSPSKMSSYRFRSLNIKTERGKSILKAWFEESAKLPNSCFSTCLFNGDTAYILLTNVSKITPSINHFISIFKKLSDKVSMNINEPIDKALKNYYGQQHPVLFKNASAGLYKSFADIDAVLDNILKIVFSSKGMIYQINTLGGAIQTSSFEANSSFPHRAYSYFSELQTYWGRKEEGELLMQRFEEVQQLISKQGITAQYRNYPDLNFKNYESLYYGSSLNKLKLLKKRFDPNNIIRHEQSIVSS